jgi:AraC family transcriptional regulator
MMADAAAISPIVESMGRSWNRQPQGAAHGSDRTGVCAALWRGEPAAVSEVIADANPDYHIVCLQMAPLEAEFFIDGKPRYAGRYVPGNVSFVHAGAAPRAIMRGQFSCMHIYIPPQLIHDVASSEASAAGERDIGFIDTVGKTSPALMRVGQDMLAEMRNNAMLTRLRTDALGLEVAVQMLRHHSTLSHDRRIARDDTNGGLAPWQIRRVTEALASNPASEQPLSDLASLVGLSPFHFSRAFKKSVGVPPHAYQVQLRIERAQALLIETQQSVTEIAFAVGYESSQSLARAFVRQIGCTPSEFRRIKLL